MYLLNNELNALAETGMNVDICERVIELSSGTLVQCLITYQSIGWRDEFPWRVRDPNRAILHEGDWDSCIQFIMENYCND